MTLLLGASITVCSVLAAFLITAVGHASALDAKVQLAADSAALAAIAEAAPYGRGIPQQVARRYASLNGAELIGCRCEPGATSVEVTVAIGDATARARSIIDARLFAPMAVSVSSEGLHGTLATSVERLLTEARGAVRMSSGFRSAREQSALWSQALARYGSAEAADDWVARPGTSMHEKGLAVDLAGDLELAARLVEELGLPMYRPLAHEPWHFELIGSRSRG